MIDDEAMDGQPVAGKRGYAELVVIEYVEQCYPCTAFRGLATQEPAALRS